uniref:dnaJ homolog subfamily C member 12 isoform X1 n=1 Tax=Myxine glutinosa TaxID=7769 RepID=UPI00358EDF2A
MDAILNYTKDPASDYYHLIGCNEFSSMEQILTEYKIRVLQCHPDKHPDNPTADKQFRMLQRAREVLGDPEMRAQYDEWCHAGIALHFEQWLALGSSVKSSMHWVVHAQNTAMLEDLPAENGKSMTNTSAETPRIWCKEDLQTQDCMAKSPSLAGYSDESFAHGSFLWTADTPSELLRKFRNYEL